VYRYTGGGAIVDEKKQTQHDEYRRGRGVVPGSDRDLFGSTCTSSTTSQPRHQHISLRMHGCVCTSWLMASYRCKQKRNVHASCPYAQPLFAAMPYTYRGGTPGRRLGHLPARRALRIASRLSGRRRVRRRFRCGYGYGLCCVLRGNVGCLSRLMR
jgi:hypothetical protein